MFEHRKEGRSTVSILLGLLIMCGPVFAEPPPEVPPIGNALPTWRIVGDGLAHSEFPDHGVQAFKIDLKQYRLAIRQASDMGQRAGTARTLASSDHAIMSFNGGFFAKDFKPLGLLISEGRTLSGLKRADWGVLSISKKGSAKLVHTRDWKRGNNIDFAIQVGPRLVVDGKALTFKRQKARRTAIGIRNNGKQLIVVIAGFDIWTSELARLMAENFDCRFALNLDGGSSTQLWTRFPQATSVPGVSVSNAVIVLERLKDRSPTP